MTRKEKLALRQHQSTRQLMGMQGIASHGITTSNSELVFFLIRPDNLSVLSSEGIRARVTALANLLRAEPAVELLVVDSRESFQRNKEFYQKRLEEETTPAIRKLLIEDILNVSGKPEWSLSVIRSILTNEKYYGDVLLQKTFTKDCISKRIVRNTGQLHMYLVTNNHQGIIDRQTFDAVQVEMARRGACKSPSRKNAPTGLSTYKSRYALSERLVCGECGTLYRRCTWSKRGKKKVVWRCVSRLDYGTKYCHKSPTLEEGSLQRTILAAISSVMSQKETIISRITGAMEQTLAPIPGETMSLSEIEQRLAEIDEEVRRIVVQTAEQGLNICSDHMKALTDECAELKKQRSRIQEQRTNNSALMKRVDDVASTLRQTSPTITEWDESIIRQLVDTVKVVSSEKIIVYLQGGTQVEQNMVE